MDAYTAFAQVYDLFMEDIPYDEWCEEITKILRMYGIEDGIILDLGCGTGQLTRRLAARGYDMIGVDGSAEMLGIAQREEILRKAEGAEEPGRCDILYLLQDLMEFELYGTVRAVVSTCNTLNYILTEEDLATVFSLVNNYLDPDGLFYFDLHTDAWYRGIEEDTIAENREEAAFIWENSYDRESRLNCYDMTFFIPDAIPEDGVFRRYTEQHLQKGWRIGEIKEALKKAGLILLRADDADTGGAADENSETIVVLAKESGKNPGGKDSENV